MKFSQLAVTGSLAVAASAFRPTSVWTAGSQVTSVSYSKKATSTYCPSAGVYPHPYKHGESIQVYGPTWTAVEVPYTTVYVWPTGAAEEKDATKAVYQDVHVIKVEVVVVYEKIVDGTPSYSAGETQPVKPTWTPKPSHDAAASATQSAAAPKKTFNVELRADNGVVRYIPDRVDAAIGDVINFKFRAAAHSVTQSTFDTPCTPLDGGFDSGLIPNMQNLDAAEFSRQFTVEKTEPLWFYCKQPNANHCGQGMVFGINPAGKMEEFIANAKEQNGALVTRPPPAPAAPVATPTPAVAAPAATHTVVVSGGFNPDGSNTLMYTPPFLEKVAKGDTLLFDFRRLNHTVTESSFDEPCKKKADTVIDTNFQHANPDDTPLAKTEAITIDTDVDVPRYFYCKQANNTPMGHCANGMVFAINLNQERFLEFQQNAKDQLPAAAPPASRYARMFKA